MAYRIVWKKRGCTVKMLNYIEYVDLKELTTILQFLEDNSDEYELVGITEYTA